MSNLHIKVTPDVAEMLDEQRCGEMPNYSDVILGILAEVDRLRSGLRLAKEWLKSDDAEPSMVIGNEEVRHECPAREAFRAWLAEGEKGGAT